MKIQISEQQRAAWEKAAQYLLPSFRHNEQAGQIQLLAERGEGNYLIDLDGNHILDFNMLKNPFGHAPERLAARLAEQAGKLWDTEDVLSPLMGRVAERLVKLLPEGFSSISLYASGSEAMEAALSVARGAVSARRKRIMAMEGNYHGWTFGSLLASTNSAGRRTHPSWLSTVLVPMPRSLDALPGDTSSVDSSATLDVVKQTLKTDNSIGIFVAEPIQMTSGVGIPPQGFWAELREILQEHDILVISDEVSTGGWRNGSLLAAPELQPDLVVFCKTIGAGLGTCAMAARNEVTQRSRASVPMRHNQLAATIVDAALDEVNRLELPLKVPTMAVRLADAARNFRAKHRWICHARAFGLLATLDLLGDGTTRQDAESRAFALARAALERGLRLACVGSQVLLLPTLIIDEPGLEKAFGILEDALQALEADSG
jgi:4-aminobutyrate aminotransferase-like enzyme